MSKRGNLFVVSGFSGSGKGTVMKQLCKNEQYALSISCTSRAPRDAKQTEKRIISFLMRSLLKDRQRVTF